MCFARGSFHDAILHLKAAIALNHKLESGLGYPLAQAHRIHLVENIVRVHLRSKDLRAGMTLAGGLLAYLSGLQLAPLPGRGWNPKSLRNLPIGFVEAKCAVLTSLVAAVIDDSERLQRRVLFRILTRAGHRHLDRVCHPGAAAWFDLMAGLLDDGAVGAEEKLASYLRAGRRDCALLWFSALRHFLEQTEHHQDRERIRFRVSTIIGGWVGLPRGIRLLVESRRP
jgi:hypothetical protein